MRLYLYAEECTVAVFTNSDESTFIAADAYDPTSKERTGQLRLRLTKNEAKTFASILRAALDLPEEA